MNSVSDLEPLWHETLGDPGITVAILDGPVDVGHSSLARAKLVQLPGLVSATVDHGLASRHGTHMASLIFGQHDGPVRGVAPGCRGLLVPIFASCNGQNLPPCKQLDLALAIMQANDAGAQVISISGGTFTPTGQAHPLLADVIKQCARRNVLIVAAAGNDGCACPHVPAALDSVLAVGAMDAGGEPLLSSNWGGVYSYQGIAAPGHELLGAQPGGGTALLTGTSCATAIVSGVAALLLSLQLRRGLRPNPHQVREALLQSAVDCRTRMAWDCPRLLVGRLNLSGAIEILFKDNTPMSSAVPDLASNEPKSTASAVIQTSSFSSPGVSATADVQPSACGCGSQPAQKVYALGEIGYNIPSAAREDALKAYMLHLTLDPVAKLSKDVTDPTNSEHMIKLLKTAEQAYIATSLEWTLSLDGLPIYAIRPQGPYASNAYSRLIDFLSDGEVERISVPGVIAGQTQLRNGDTVPILVPELRGMHSWNTKALIEAMGLTPGAGQDAAEKFLHKIYHELRNLGVRPEDRALNYAATNTYNLKEILNPEPRQPVPSRIQGQPPTPPPAPASTPAQLKMELDSISVVRSPISRPGSDCWDVEIYFFYPQILNPGQTRFTTDRRVFRFTVDVSDVVPVLFGKVRSWHTR